MAKVAFMTFGILLGPRNSGTVKGFTDRIPGVYEAVDGSDGFVDRSKIDETTGQHSWGELPVPRFILDGEESCIARTLSLWDDLESVFAFGYAGNHAEALSHRMEWFRPGDYPTYVAWWIDDGEIPNWVDAHARHEHLHDNGPTPYAFNFKAAFGADGEPVEISRAKAKAKVIKNLGSMD